MLCTVNSADILWISSSNFTYKGGWQSKEFMSIICLLIYNFETDDEEKYPAVPTPSESRVVRAGQEAAGEWTSEGGLNGAIQLETDGLPPVIHRARTMMCEARGRFITSIWVVSQKLSFCPMMGTKAFFYVQIPGKDLIHLPPKSILRGDSYEKTTFFCTCPANVNLANSLWLIWLHNRF